VRVQPYPRVSHLSPDPLDCRPSEAATPGAATNLEQFPYQELLDSNRAQQDYWGRSFFPTVARSPINAHIRRLTDVRERF
jgi:hypothetical protein